MSNTLPAGTSSQNIAVTPLANTNLQTPVVVTLALLPGPAMPSATPATRPW